MWIAVLFSGWAVCRVTDTLQDCCFSRICSSYDEDSEIDLWNRAGLFRIHSYRLESGNRFRFQTSWFTTFTRSGPHAQVHTLIKLYVKIIQTPSRSCFLPRGAGVSI